MVLNNPYLADVQSRAVDGVPQWKNRRQLVQQYAWAIPNEEAIATIAALSPIVEVGAGTGYWACLVAQAGGHIDAYDIAPPTIRNNTFKHNTLWHPVMPVEWLKWEKTQRYTLMLCWPPYGRDMASKTLQQFRGTRVIYIGENAGGCTGDDAFHEALKRYWHLIQSLPLPQWEGVYDRLQVWEC